MQDIKGQEQKKISNEKDLKFDEKMKDTSGGDIHTTSDTGLYGSNQVYGSGGLNDNSSKVIEGKSDRDLNKGSNLGTVGR
jgi:hypothetical protein